jgi:PAS domain S-box-containing protein
MPELPQIYNSRIVKSYIRCMNAHYPEANIDIILQHAGISKYEMDDPGHWFNQQQVDRFFEKTVAVTGNPAIAREAGRFAVLNETAGPVRQLALGLLKVSSLYLLLAKLYPMLSRGAMVKTQKLASNRVQIIVEPFPGVMESPHQCENRIGVFEALSTLFTDNYAKIDHTACIHKADGHCCYVVSWREPVHSKWKRIFGITAAVSALVAGSTFFMLPIVPWLLVLSASGIVSMGIYLRATIFERQALTHTIQNQGNVAEDHIKEIDYRYRSALLVQKIGQATSTILDVNKLSAMVLENIQHYLDFDRGLIMLADKERKRLLYSAGYGFDETMLAMLVKTQFRLDHPAAKGIFIRTFREQRPVLVDDIDMMKDSMSPRSQQLMKQIGSKSLICLPIVHKDRSLGILAVDNLITKRPLTQSDMNLLMGVAYQAAASIINADAYQELQDSEERYRSLYEKAPTAYISLRIDDAVIVNCNSAAVRLLGYCRDDLLNSSLLSHVSGDAGNQDKARWMHKLLQDGHPVYNETVELIRNDRQTVWVNVTLEPFSNTQDQIVEGRCILVDTTQQKQLEEQLRKAQRMEAIGTLAGGVAHDLSNILAAIVSYPDLLLMDVPPDSPLYDPLVKIKGAGMRAAAIVQDLLTLSRRGVAVTEIVSINDVVKDYLESPEYEDLVARHPNIQIKIDLHPELAAIKGSSIHLTKTLMNVLMNAAEALPGGGRIQIKTHNQMIEDRDSRLKGKPGKHAVLTVCDNGHGIASDDLNRVFEPFFTKKVMGRSGTGLGMAIVWAAVQDLHGFIDIQSQVGQGTTVELFFPATLDQKASRPLNPELIEYTGKGEQILVIDDNAEHREIAIRMLNRLGYKVTAVECGEEAIVKFEQNFRPDLVVLDMLLGPGLLDGLSTFRRILDFCPQQKAVIASGLAESTRVKKARELGVSAYVKKPYSLKEIGTAVRYTLDLSES